MSARRPAPTPEVAGSGSALRGGLLAAHRRLSAEAALPVTAEGAAKHRGHLCAPVGVRPSPRINATVPARPHVAKRHKGVIDVCCGACWMVVVSTSLACRSARLDSRSGAGNPAVPHRRLDPSVAVAARSAGDPHHPLAADARPLVGARLHTVHPDCRPCGPLTVGNILGRVRRSVDPEDPTGTSGMPGKGS